MSRYDAFDKCALCDVMFYFCGDVLSLYAMHFPLLYRVYFSIYIMYI